MQSGCAAPSDIRTAASNRQGQHDNGKSLPAPARHLGHALAAADDTDLGAGRVGHAEHGALLRQRPSHEPGLRSAQQAGSINAWCHAIARPQP